MSNIYLDSNALTAKAEAAFRQAMVQVIERARQAGTPVIVWKNERITELTPDEAEAELAAELQRRGPVNL